MHQTGFCSYGNNPYMIAYKGIQDQNGNYLVGGQGEGWDNLNLVVDVVAS